MAKSKVLPNISQPGGIRMPEGGRNPSVGEHARTQNLARPGRSVGAGNAGGRLPLQSPPTNLVGGKIGQPDPQTDAAATVKPKRKGVGANFYGEY